MSCPPPPCWAVVRLKLASVKGASVSISAVRQAGATQRSAAAAVRLAWKLRAQGFDPERLRVCPVEREGFDRWRLRPAYLNDAAG